MKMENEKRIKKDIEKRLKDFAACKIQRERRLELFVKSQHILPTLSFLKSYGFIHLSVISCVDWIDKKEFELVYNLWSYKEKVTILVKTRMARNKPVMDSVIPVYKIAETYEREIHEMFGVDFPGNPNLTPFILEDWSGPPPMRKDFNTRKYVEQKYGMKDLTEELRKGMDIVKGVRDDDEIL